MIRIRLGLHGTEILMKLKVGNDKKRLKTSRLECAFLQSLVSVLRVSNVFQLVYY